MSREPVAFFLCNLRTYPEAITAGATLLLAIATFVLAISTHTAAQAAKNAAEHIPRVERAYMFGGPAVNGTVYDIPPGTVKVIIDIKNHGKTPGILIAGYGEFLSGPPTIPPKDFSFVGGNKWDWDFVFSSNQGEILKDHPFQGTKHSDLHFIGYITYRTMFDDKVHTSFWCVKPRLVDNVREQWIMVPAPGWNNWD